MFLGLRVLDIRKTNEVEDALAKQVIDKSCHDIIQVPWFFVGLIRVFRFLFCAYEICHIPFSFFFSCFFCAAYASV